MVFEIKETKRQSRAVKVTHPPADRRQLHKRSGFTSAMKRQRNETTSQARLPGIGEDVKQRLRLLSEERLSPHEDIMRDTRGLSFFSV